MRSTEHADLAAALHKMLISAPDAWSGLAGMGVMSLALEACVLDLVVVCEELGHHAVPGPVAESLAAAPALIGEFDGVATVAMPPLVPYAADADVADHVLLVTDGVVYRAEPGARRSSVDPSRSLHSVRPVSEAGRADGRAFEMAALATAAYLLGAGRALLEMSVRHAGVREQFGRPVGANQAVQHRLADVAVGLEFARPLLDEAAGSLAPRDVSAAKVACGDAGYAAARAALQVHGAIGYTAEHEMSRFLLKVRALTGAWGSTSWHRGRIAEEL
jgi:hypothetical protein